MKSEDKLQLTVRVQQVLAELIDIPLEQIRAGVDIQPLSECRPDTVVGWGPYVFMVVIKTNSSPGNIALAVMQVQKCAASGGKNNVPVIAVPYMTFSGRQICEQAGVGWFDFSGNGSISARGLRVRVEGRPDCFKQAGRPANLFAPKSSRLVRWLLTHPGRTWSQREISKQTGIDEGQLSRLVARLEEQQYTIRDSGGSVGVRDPDVLLDAWRESYSFARHHLMKGYIPARSSEALLRDLAKKLVAMDVQHAATGLAGAWLCDGFAGFRLVTFYVRNAVPESSLADLGWRGEERGANVWLAVPDDEGVFQGAGRRDDVWCAHPVQIYVDLKAHPERSSEAAAHLRAGALKWGDDDR